MYSQEEKQAIAVIFRIGELEEKPVRGKFDIPHLKEIHRRIFQDFPRLGSAVTPGRFRPPTGDHLDWVKTRRLESVNAVSNVAYSNMSVAAQNTLNILLSAIDIQKFSMLSTEEFAETLADLYVAVDYIHPFLDGNSRTLRTFTKQIASNAGFALHWEALSKTPAGRDILYIARDISVNKIALTHSLTVGTQRDILFTLDQLGNNRDMRSILRDIVQPATVPCKPLSGVSGPAEAKGMKRRAKP